MSGAGLIGWAVYHKLYGSRHRVRFGMRVGMVGLALWSFLMAMAHGAGLMLVPFLLPVAHDGSPATHMAGHHAVSDSFPLTLAAIWVHTLAMLVATGVIAVVVYEWVGLAFLRRGCINLDLLWTSALVATGLILRRRDGIVRGERREIGAIDTARPGRGRWNQSRERPPVQSFKTAALGLVGLFMAPAAVHAITVNPAAPDLTRSGAGYASLLIFAIAYLVVMAEEFTRLRKSQPVILAAGMIWGMIALVYADLGDTHRLETALGHNLLQFSELFLFLLSAMTYVNAMEERLVFDALRSWLVRKGFGYRSLFWLTGGLAFTLSPILDNLTTALVMCAVLLAVGRDNSRFVTPGCVNIVVAANAGGAFSPFGDITTLMVWQEGLVAFDDFIRLFVPALVNFLVPAALMHFAIPAGRPPGDEQRVRMRRGGKGIMVLFAATIVTTVCFHNFLHLPPFLGMMTGLACLQFFAYYLVKSHRSADPEAEMTDDIGDSSRQGKPFDIFRRMDRIEWDTLLFFFGVILCVGGLGFIGYLALLSETIYVDIGPVFANIAVGLLSAIVDNIPVMFAVLSMNPDMSLGHWLLVTLTAGIGGSMLSIGSAAGVALMGQAQGRYTFFGHLKWTPAILLGYAASILTHLWINASTFQMSAGG